MLTGVDHIIFSIEADRLDEVESHLLEAGLAKGDRGNHPEYGTANRTVLLKGGAFVELLYRRDPEQAPTAWFARMPRIQAFGFGSTDVPADAELWQGAPEAWTKGFTREREDGVTQSSIGAGPAGLGEFYVFITNRTQGKYFPKESDVEFACMRLRGRDAKIWEARLRRWLQLERRDGRYWRGDVELVFEESDLPGINPSPVFRTATPRSPIPLINGEITFVAKDA